MRGYPHERIHDNSGGWVPGPSDWYVHLVAEVPADELNQWTAGLKPSPAPDPAWLADVPTNLPTDRLTEWFADREIEVGTKTPTGVIVGLDRERHIVAYCNVRS